MLLANCEDTVNTNITLTVREVAPAQSGHHDQRPVEAGDPRVLLAFDPALDHMKQDGVQRDDREQRQEVLEQRAEIGARVSVSNQVRQLAAEEFHDGLSKCVGELDANITPSARRPWLSRSTRSFVEATVRPTRRDTTTSARTWRPDRYDGAYGASRCSPP